MLDTTSSAESLQEFTIRVGSTEHTIMDRLAEETQIKKRATPRVALRLARELLGCPTLLELAARVHAHRVLQAQMRATAAMNWTRRSTDRKGNSP
jgi:hypothetical protein